MQRKWPKYEWLLFPSPVCLTSTLLYHFTMCVAIWQTQWRSLKWELIDIYSETTYAQFVNWEDLEQAALIYKLLFFLFCIDGFYRVFNMIVAGLIFCSDLYFILHFQQQHVTNSCQLLILFHFLGLIFEDMFTKSAVTSLLC